MLLRVPILFVVSINAFSQPAAVSGDYRVYPYGPGAINPFSNAFGLSDAQMKQRREDLTKLLDDSQKTRLASLPRTVQEACEAAAPGLFNTDWQCSRVCNNYTAATAALSLGNVQLEQLHRIRRAADDVGRQLSGKQTQLDRLLQADSGDVLSVGQLALDIARLRKQIPGSPSVLNQALAVLNPAQRAKLADISRGAVAARDAVQLGLMDTPPQWQAGECLCN